MSKKVWFWQRIVSPHMVELAEALAKLGYSVIYVAEQPMSADRAEQGWEAKEPEGIEIIIASNWQAIETLVKSASLDSIHICQGIRSNGLVKTAQVALKKRKLQQWVVMETVEDKGLKGFAKRLVYRGLFFSWRNHIQGILATGWSTKNWIIQRGFPEEKIYPFAYFLSDIVQSNEISSANEEFIVLYAGRLIPLKRVDWIINSLSQINESKGKSVALHIVGNGPLELQLKEMSEIKLKAKVSYLGLLPMTETRQQMAKADLLVLPSVHDGWGAVVSEALMAGTPVVASNACGSAGVVLESGYGGVFAADSMDELTQLLSKAIERGKISLEERRDLAQWAQSLGAKYGAKYLSKILNHKTGQKPVPPWVRS